MISKKPWTATVIVDEEKQVTRKGRKYFVKGGAWQINSADGKLVAHDGGIPQMVRRSLTDDEISNVYLMAAAPVLLDALQNVMDAFYDDWLENTETYETVKAAIELATRKKYQINNQSQA